MKLLCLFILLLISFVTKCQTYSTVVTDTEIIDFINEDIKRDSAKVKKNIRRAITIPSKDNFYFTDTIDFNDKSNMFMSQFIFKKILQKGKVITANLDTLTFSRADINFFLKQIEGFTKNTFWKKPFKKSVLVDKPEYKSNNYRQVKSVVFNYSIPIFSLDKKKAILIKHFFCGLLCGGSGYYFYEMNTHNEWKLVKEFNVLAE